MAKIMHFCIVTVTYFPNERLIKQIKVLQESEHVDRIVIVDNTAKKSRILSQIVSKKVEILYNKSNEGIGAAQNKGIKRAISLGYKWVITFDQDTVPNPNLFKKYQDFLATNQYKDIGIINTDYYDVGTRHISYGNRSPMFVEVVLSSGSLFNTSLFEKVGFFKEKYFMDQIDNEFCHRVRRNGYKNIVLPGNDMEHALGNIEKRMFLGYPIHIYNQKPLRTYYRTRNILWMIREHREKSFIYKELKILIKDIPRILLEKDTLLKLRMYFKGMIDGLFRNINE